MKKDTCGIDGNLLVLVIKERWPFAQRYGETPFQG